MFFSSLGATCSAKGVFIAVSACMPGAHRLVHANCNTSRPTQDNAQPENGHSDFSLFACRTADRAHHNCAASARLEPNHQSAVLCHLSITYEPKLHVKLRQQLHAEAQYAGVSCKNHDPCHLLPRWAPDRSQAAACLCACLTKVKMYQTAADRC